MKNRLLILAIMALTAMACTKKTEPVVTLDKCDITLNGITFTNSINGAAELVSEADGVITFSAEPHTDYFRAPNGRVLDNAPILLTEIDNTRPFTFKGHLTPGFTEKGRFNAAALYVFSSPLMWQKFAFEQDMRGLHKVVSVRTMETSDDNNHDTIMESPSLWYKISSDGTTMAFYFSLDGQAWNLIRTYRNNYPEKAWLGISSQAPGDDPCVSTFDSLSLVFGTVGDFRLGQE
ncbi:MAG: DUF1349 domain-containing protein [Bacteroidales bacterium]|nr:DUF1349 domain-containing protein [Bacteroidales bacterium]MBR5054717.1 DUF1349 domain-containing protein [Bacteroidales bacterium]